jgi:signal transduction histidine kinase
VRSFQRFPQGTRAPAGGIEPSVLAWVCYLLFVGVWALDLVTPQLFIASVLFNAPIAMSSIALDRGLTIRLTVFAEIANVISGYVNAAQAGYHTSFIAVGDRALLAASFLLVAYMATKTQELAQRAGMVRAREEQAHRERRLRFAAERVHASLSAPLVVNAIASEGLQLTGATAGIFVFGSELGGESTLATLDPERRVRISRGTLSPEVSSLFAALQGATALEQSGRDLVASYALQNLGFSYGLAGEIDLEREHIRALLLRQAPAWDADDARTLQRFFENAASALVQARLFASNVEQTERIAEQNRVLVERGAVIRDLVYALAHDLRTPLAAADVTLRQAKTGAYGALPERYEDVIETSLESNAEMRRIVESLLMIARYESEDWSRVRDRFNLGSTIEAVYRELQPTALAKGVALEVAPLEGEYAVLGDESEIHRACINLVANAIAATPAGGFVRMRVTRDDDANQVTIEDNGYGVPEEERGALFQRFGAGKRRRGSGTGLGLYVVRLIAERHGGSVSYESANHRGSRFILRLPRAEEAHSRKAH